MKVLVACEFSGRVREAFRARGHDAWSCDTSTTEIPSEKHIQARIETVNVSSFDLMIAHPPCTYLAVSGARWFAGRMKEQDEAAGFFLKLWNAPVKRIALENPIGVMSTRFRKSDQIIQPWQYGHGETKATCLWLKNLPLLKPTNIVNGRNQRVHHEPPSPDRWKNRSRTYTGIADAMADQWGKIET
jgi:site-specific DNA-cytosine methylase